ncbi:Ribosomal large subunit pseudouridine synthase D [Candidatus Providencia siddallii]|uniref:Pseudouridine synthase n=1 Tax=Candidatus Providencia siddallii TaxID=1715285 RepID=A0A0M6W762_9GAMM|nr:Ribosomal large subunit pseudouridine synthase D [Candidatus Providencia siddallii]
MKKHIKINLITTKSQIGMRLDNALVNLLPNFTRSKIKEMILHNNVNVNNKNINKPKTKIFGKEHISINFITKNNDICHKPQNIPLNIIFEDEHILVINKPCNLVVHPGVNNTDGTILNALLYLYPEINNIPRAGIIHRLDKNTTGLMIIAKNNLAHMYLIKSLQLRQITREYDAIVIGKMTSGGVINKPISRHPIKRTKMSVNIKGRPAITYYRITKHFRAHTQLLIRLETGRTHQILVHMSYIKHPLLGNSLYGGAYRHINEITKKNFEIISAFNRQALHASMLRFYHPFTKKQIELHAPLPNDMVKLIKSLKNDTKFYKKNIQ